ncbi:MAG: hypothetical protein WCC18_15470, partial [Candidatus Acidiferrales bacterium]
VQQPSTWCGRSEQILLNQVGCEARKIPADAEVFFLDFPFYRTNRITLPRQSTWSPFRAPYSRRCDDVEFVIESVNSMVTSTYKSIARYRRSF